MENQSWYVIEKKEGRVGGTGIEMAATQIDMAIGEMAVRENPLVWALQYHLMREAAQQDRLVLLNRKLLATRDPLQCIRELIARDSMQCAEAKRLRSICLRRCAAELIYVRLRDAGSAALFRARMRCFRLRCMLHSRFDAIDSTREPLAEEAASVLGKYVVPLVCRHAELSRRLATSRAKAEDEGQVVAGHLAPKHRSTLAHCFLREQTEILSLESKLRHVERLDLLSLRARALHGCGARSESGRSGRPRSSVPPEGLTRESPTLWTRTHAFTRAHARIHVHVHTHVLNACMHTGAYGGPRSDRCPAPTGAAGGGSQLGGQTERPGCRGQDCRGARRGGASFGLEGPGSRVRGASRRCGRRSAEHARRRCPLEAAGLEDW